MNIMRFRPLFFVISILLLGFAVFSMIFWKFKPSIDFAGGTVWELNFSKEIDTVELSNIFEEKEITLSTITPTSDNQFSLKFANINPDQKTELNEAIVILDPDVQELKFETLGPTLGKELLRKTVFAIVLSSLFLFLFIGRRFKDFSFGISAVIAMFHDTIILIGSFSALGHFFNAELDALFVTAVLTTLSSSVHDTVVTFDRIRELKRHNYKIDWVDLANQAVTETLTRSINNSMTIIFMLTALVALGGQSTKWFAAALLIGVVSGTYSSIGVAIPSVLFFKKRSKRK
jgi:preprotein translocase subunit SecF